VTTFLLIRHAHTALVGVGLAGRQQGHGLSDEGRTQARQLAARLASVKLDAVYASPLARAMETAEAVAGTWNLPVLPLEGFNEIDFGTWTGSTFELLNGDSSWQRWNQFRSMSRPPNGEMMLAAQAQAVRELVTLHERHNDAAVAIVSHADIIKAVLSYLMGIPLDLFHRLEIDPASVSVVRLHDDDVRIICVNHRGDLII
jgi:probable phosphoglycerate mutase